MSKANNDLRMFAKGCGVPLWAIADKMGISDQTLLRNWRKELAENDKKSVKNIIEQLKKDNLNDK